MSDVEEQVAPSSVLPLVPLVIGAGCSVTTGFCVAAMLPPIDVDRDGWTSVVVINMRANIQED